ncbi:MATE family efflux transporter, partial [Klebsiella oxytoca]
GKFGAPQLGGIGCGVATASVFWAMFLMMRYYVRRAPTQRDVMPKKRLVLPEFHTIKRITLLGLPVGLALFFEVTLFAVVALLVSPLGVTAVASHQIALNFS